MKYSLAGFNGQRPDPVSGHYHTGNGYRTYNPALGRFSTPDSWSPFAAGGINPYAWCAGDPVNRADPSGHFSPGQGIGLALGFVAGIALSIMTEGAALPAVLTLVVTASGDAAIGAGTELLAEATDGQPVNWCQVGIAAALGAAMSPAGNGLGRAAQRVNHLYGTGVRYTMTVLRRLKRLNEKIGIPMSGEFRNARFLGIYRSPAGVAWNICFDDELPVGIRRNYILAGHWEGTSLRVQNEVPEGERLEVTSYDAHAFAGQFNRDEGVRAYRLIMPQSAQAIYTRGVCFARSFRYSLTGQVPVEGYLTTPVLRGVVAERLGGLRQLVTDMDRYGYVIHGDAAQSALSRLSDEFSYRPGSIVVEGGEPKVYPTY